MVYLDGSLVKGPKALCELQGYVYDAWLRMAEVFDFDIRFWRNDSETQFEVLWGDPKAIERRNFGA